MPRQSPHAHRMYDVHQSQAADEHDYRHQGGKQDVAIAEVSPDATAERFE
jgi:hypothetical protein